MAFAQTNEISAAREAVRSAEASYGPEHPATAMMIRNLALATLGVELQSADGVVAAPDSRRDDGHWQEAFLWARGFTISAGSNEIMRNLIAETGLGLPREPRPAGTEPRPARTEPRR